MDAGETRARRRKRKAADRAKVGAGQSRTAVQMDRVGSSSMMARPAERCVVAVGTALTYFVGAATATVAVVAEIRDEMVLEVNRCVRALTPLLLHLKC